MCDTIISASPIPAQVSPADIRIHTANQQPGDFLVFADVPGYAAHVVTLTQDGDGRQFATCTCDFDLFEHPVAVLTLRNATGHGPCGHIQAVWCFLYVRPDVYAAEVTHVEGLLARLVRTGAPESALAPRRVELARLSEIYRHRQAATARRIGVAVATPLLGAEGLPVAVVSSRWFPALAWAQVAA